MAFDHQLFPASMLEGRCGIPTDELGLFPSETRGVGPSRLGKHLTPGGVLPDRRPAKTPYYNLPDPPGFDRWSLGV